MFFHGYKEFVASFSSCFNYVARCNHQYIIFFGPILPLTHVAAMLCPLINCVLAIQAWRCKVLYLIQIPTADVLELAGYVALHARVGNTSDVASLISIPL